MKLIDGKSLRSSREIRKKKKNILSIKMSKGQRNEVPQPEESATLAKSIFFYKSLKTYSQKAEE